MNSITLRMVRDSLGSRFLGASIRHAGDLVIEGQDLGDGVEAAFGEGLREYEWTYTIARADLPMLLKALGAQTDVLTVLSRRFSDERAVDLRPFLDEHGIPYEFWSRIGD